MVSQEADLLDYVVDLDLTAKEWVDETEHMKKADPKDEDLRLWTTDQQGCAERQQAIKEPLFAVILSPSLDALGQSQVNRLSNQIFIIVMDLIAPDNFVLVVEQQEAKGNDESQPYKEKMQRCIDSFQSIPIASFKKDVDER